MTGGPTLARGPEEQQSQREIPSLVMNQIVDLARSLGIDPALVGQYLRTAEVSTHGVTIDESNPTRETTIAGLFASAILTSSVNERGNVSITTETLVTGVTGFYRIAEANGIHIIDPRTARAVSQQAEQYGIVPQEALEAVATYRILAALRTEFQTEPVAAEHALNAMHPNDPGIIAFVRACSRNSREQEINGTTQYYIPPREIGDIAHAMEVQAEQQAQQPQTVERTAAEQAIMDQVIQWGGNPEAVLRYIDMMINRGGIIGGINTPPGITAEEGRRNYEIALGIFSLIQQHVPENMYDRPELTAQIPYSIVGFVFRDLQGDGLQHFVDGLPTAFDTERAITPVHALENLDAFVRPIVVERFGEENASSTGNVIEYLDYFEEAERQGRSILDESDQIYATGDENLIMAYNVYPTLRTNGLTIADFEDLGSEQMASLRLEVRERTQLPV